MKTNTQLQKLFTGIFALSSLFLASACQIPAGIPRVIDTYPKNNDVVGKNIQDIVFYINERMADYSFFSDSSFSFTETESGRAVPCSFEYRDGQDGGELVLHPLETLKADTGYKAVLKENAGWAIESRESISEATTIYFVTEREGAIFVPKVYDITPETGKISEGTVLTITGYDLAGFSTSTIPTVAYENGAAADFILVSSTKILVKVGPGAVSGHLKVSTGLGIAETPYITITE